MAYMPKANANSTKTNLFFRIFGSRGRKNMHRPKPVFESLLNLCRDNRTLVKKHKLLVLGKELLHLSQVFENPSGNGLDFIIGGNHVRYHNGL